MTPNSMAHIGFATDSYMASVNIPELFLKGRAAVYEQYVHCPLTEYWQDLSATYQLPSFWQAT